LTTLARKLLVTGREVLAAGKVAQAVFKMHRYAWLAGAHASTSNRLRFFFGSDTSTLSGKERKKNQGVSRSGA